MTSEPEQGERSENTYILSIIFLEIKRFHVNNWVHTSSSEEDTEYCLFLENTCSLMQKTFSHHPQKVPVKQWPSIYLSYRVLYPPLMSLTSWLQIRRSHKSPSCRVCCHEMESTVIHKTLTGRAITKINSGFCFLRDKAILSAGNNDVFPVPSLYSTAVLNGVFQTPPSALRWEVAKAEADRDNKTKERTRSVQCSQARVHMQSPIAAPVSLPWYPGWSTSRGAAVSPEQRRKLPNPWHK